MSLNADEIVDRRRLRRRISFWRVAAFVAVAVALVALITAVGGGEDAIRSFSPHVARIEITGFISEDREQLKLIEDLTKDKAVKAVIVSIDSGGGTTAGGEALYQAIRKLAAAKPTVAQMSTIAASAAYMTAIATDHIVARRTTLTGSIGVIFQYPEVSALLTKLGVNMNEIKSAPLKAEPSPFHPASEEAKAVIAGVIADTYQWFVDIVAERRGIDRGAASGLADGRIFTGNQALAAKLVDALGGEDTVREWLATKSVSKDLPIRDWKPKGKGSSFLLGDAAIGWLARQIGIMPEAARTLDRLLPQRLMLDGLLSVWQGSLDQHAGEGAP